MVTDLLTEPLPKSAQRRAELLAEHAQLDAEIRQREDRQDLIKAEIAGLDFAIAEAREPVERQQKEHAPRLDISAAVLDLLSTGVPRTVHEAARFIERKPGQVSAALTRLSKDGKVALVAGTSDRYQLVGKEAAQAAE